MNSSLRLLGLLLYAPARGIREAGVRRGLLFPIVFALLTQTGYSIYAQGPFYVSFLIQQTRLVPESAEMVKSAGFRGAFVVLISFFSSAVSSALIGLIFVPAVVFLVARQSRRIRLAAALQLEYSRAAPAIFFAYGIAYVWGTVLVLFLRATGLLNLIVQRSLGGFEQVVAQNPTLSAMIGPEGHPAWLTMEWLQLLIIPGILIALSLAVRSIFDLGRGRSFLVMISGCIAMLAVQFLLSSLPGVLVAAPLLVLMSYLVLRATFLASLERQRTSAAFQQAVTTADSSPYDSRAQYDLGLMLLERGDTIRAAERFERAAGRDPLDWDARFQLGRIARGDGRWAEAIKQFEPVVENDFAHSNYEIWREVGATYLGAGQFADAVPPLERFLDHRPHDAEGWYLLGRAQEGLGSQIEAVAAMHACIGAVEGTPGETDEKGQEWRAKAETFLQRTRK